MTITPKAFANFSPRLELATTLGSFINIPTNPEGVPLAITLSAPDAARHVINFEEQDANYEVVATIKLTRLVP
jgi:hypothetical protein